MQRQIIQISRWTHLIEPRSIAKLWFLPVFALWMSLYFECKYSEDFLIARGAKRGSHFAVELRCGEESFVQRNNRQLTTVHALTVRKNVYLRNRIGFDVPRNESDARDTADSSFLGENQYQPVWYSYLIFRIWSFNFAIWNSICELQCHRVGNRRSWSDSKLEIQGSLSTIQNINGQP